jgi:hypothetical protein
MTRVVGFGVRRGGVGHRAEDDIEIELGAVVA